MLTFFHTYADDVFPTLVNSGLWREGDGLKLMHKPGFAPPHDFNHALAAGAPLEALLRELRCPFYVDRLQGGIGYTNRYPYDPALLEKLRSLLGDGFFGFQMHEWASNLRSDEKRIRELFAKENADPSDPAQWSRLWDRVRSGELPLFLEAYPPEEWRALTLSDGLASFLRSAESLYARRARETENGAGAPCYASEALYTRRNREIENGAGAPCYASEALYTRRARETENGAGAPCYASEALYARRARETENGAGAPCYASEALYTRRARGTDNGAEAPCYGSEALYARRTQEINSEFRIPNSELVSALRSPHSALSLLFPADSYFMAPRTELAHGARLLLPEVGWQIPNLRVQLAFTRGMANAAGVPWGIYYECWQDTKDAGFTIPFSLRQGQDEWQEDLLHKGNGAKLPFNRREHGGSSLSLLARAWRLAYFSGARYLGEEYGVCNTFRDLREAALSPYGEAKREFLRFTEALPDPGEPFVPVAAVLPKAMEMLDITFGDRWLEYPFTDPACPLPEPEMRGFRKTVEAVFGRPGRYGNMGHVLKNGGLPGVCDIIYEDTPTLPRYDYLIDLTGDPAFARRHQNAVLPEEADRLLDGLLPCRVGDGLFAAYNRAGDGWYVLVMNNDGVYHDNFAPDVLLPEATVHTKITPRTPNAAIRKAAGDGTLSRDGGYSLTMRAGEWILLRVSA